MRRARWRVGLLAGLGNMTSADLRVHADIVERTSKDRHGDRARLGAVRNGSAEVAPLARSDKTEDQPQHEQQGSDAHEATLSDQRAPETDAELATLRERASQRPHRRQPPRP